MIRIIMVLLAEVIKEATTIYVKYFFKTDEILG